MMRDTPATADEVGCVVSATQAPETEAPVLDATTATRLPARILDNDRAVAPLHFGTFGRWPVKVLWCLGGMAPGVLAASGFLVWQTRGRSRARKLRDASGTRPDQPVWMRLRR